jgi:hypothetical protein
LKGWDTANFKVSRILFERVLWKRKNRKIWRNFLKEAFEIWKNKKKERLGDLVIEKGRREKKIWKEMICSSQWEGRRNSGKKGKRKLRSIGKNYLLSPPPNLFTFHLHNNHLFYFFYFYLIQGKKCNFLNYNNKMKTWVFFFVIIPNKFLKKLKPIEA